MSSIIENARLFDIHGVTILGNPNNGAVIGLDDDGVTTINKFRVEGITPDTVTTPLDAQIAEALANYGFCGGMRTGLHSAYLHLTDRCNLTCVGCYSFVPDRNRREDLTTDQVLAIIDELAAQATTELVLSGGEPLMRRDVPTIAARAKEHGMTVSLITNGTIAPRRFDEVLPHIDILNVSVDGYNAETHFIRNGWIMQRVLDFVRTMKERCRVHLVFTLHHRNVAHMLDYVALAEGEGLSFNFSVFSVDPTDPAMADFLLTPDDYAAIANTVNAADNIYIEDTVLASGGSGVQGLRCVENCGVGESLISIASDGTVYPCHMLHDERLKMGNVVSEDLGTILSRGTAVSIPVDAIADCRACAFRYLCGGGCRGRSVLHHGDAAQRDPYCAITHRFLSERTEILKEM